MLTDIIQRPQQPTSNSAHLAATQAFLANRVSQGNLSASAAAAALRAMSPPPTPVADVQTKRMQRRSSSTSLASAPRGRQRGGLDRNASSGSMTERTFRSPSPGRPVTPTGTGVPPPVPKLPEDIPPVPLLQERPSKRSMSLDTHGARRTKQPMPPLPKANVTQTAQIAAVASSAAQNSDGMNGYDVQRTDSRNSVNFSRPLSPPPQSPPSSSRNQQKQLGNGISSADKENVRYNVTTAAEAPVKKKKKKTAPRAAEGSHLQSGSMASRPVTTPLAPGPEISPETSPAQAPKKKKKVALTGQSTHFPQVSESTSSDQDLESSLDQQRRSQRASGQLMKQPSVVREDWEGEQEYEPSPGQQRDAQDLSPVASPSTAVQSRKLTAANMSRKIEEPLTPPLKTVTPAAQAEVHQAVTDSPTEADTSHLTVQEPHAVRQSSLSPSRSTRFSENPSDLAAGRKHEPLGRSVSPVKSALKHHSPSSAEHRPHKSRGSSATPSDASDSNMSADGSVRRKKSVRVSFEPKPEVVGIAAAPQGTDSPVIQSPQAKEPAKKSGFFGLGRSRPVLTTIPSDENLDDHMQPRPQLPSFGSIRNRQRRVDSSESVEVAPTADKLLPSPAQASSASSDVSSSPDIPAQDQGASSDHAIGAIFSQDARGKTTLHDPSLPLPPVVTSVEGGGYVSDTESEITVEGEQQQPSSAAKSDPKERSDPSGVRANSPTQSESVHAPKTAYEDSLKKDAESEKLNATPSTAAMPILSVQPPTPGNEEDKPSDQWLVEVPGGFPTAANAGAPQGATPVTSDALARTFGPSEAELRRAQAAQAQVEEESASDGDSIYSDAEEDLSDHEGWGSIDAIVYSPVVDPPRESLARSPPQSPLADRPQRPHDVERTASWDEAQQHWSGIAQQSREAKASPSSQTPSQTLQEASGPAPQRASQQLQQVTGPAKPKKKKQTPNTSTAAIGAVAAATPPAARKKAPQQAQPTAMKSSMRQQPTSQAPGPPATGAMRTSMRQKGNASNPRSLQASKWATTEPTRPLSPAQQNPTPASPQRAALQKKHIPTSTPLTATKPVYKPPPAPHANDSDSDSSFRKARRTKKSADGGFTMRSSMRGSAQPAPTQSAGRGAVRSMSPPVRRPFSPVNEQHAMRSSMRGSADVAAPTLRGPPKEQKRSSSLFGRRKAKSPSRAPPLPMTAGRRSRIADSDDEDGPPATAFKSRFVDSSDDEADARPMRPVRGIPKRRDDGDSTDLDDSSDEERKKSKRQLQPAIRIDTDSAQKSQQPTDVPLSPNTMKKKGLFSRFRSKKNKSDQPQVENGLASPASNSRPGTNDEDTPFDKNMGFGSSAERDAMIRQTMAKLEAAKQDEPSTAPASSVDADAKPATTPIIARPQSPTGGKLQRRRPERIMSDSWPLPESQAVTPDDRPATAGTDAAGKYQTNGMRSLRPALHERKATNESLHTDGGATIFSTKTKKKRFTMLRKAFGLKD